MFFKSNNIKPVKIWNVVAVSTDTGELFITRAFRYKSEALQYITWLKSHEEGVDASYMETMLY